VRLGERSVRVIILGNHDQLIVLGEDVVVRWVENLRK
jgi:hypothetical protein